MTSPVTVDPAQEMQTAIWEILRSDAQIMTYVTDVLDADPDQHNYPDIVVPDPISIPNNTHDSVGRKITVRIHTRVRGDVRDRNQRIENIIGGRIIAILDHQHRVLDTFVDGHKVWMVHHEEGRQVPEKDRSVRHRIDRISVWTSQD
jgi:hypothetical protein